MAGIELRGRAFHLSKGRLLAVVAALVLPAGGLVTAVSPAFAGAMPIGNVTCNAGGSLSFSPPLTPTGTRGGHEKVMLTEVLDGCVGSPGTNLPSSPQFVKTKPIKLPAAVVGGKKVVGDCQTIVSQFSQAAIKQTIRWGHPFLQTKVVGGGEEIFTDKFGRIKVRFKWDRSDGGPVNVALALSQTSSQALTNCINGTGASLTNVAFDPTISSMTGGTAVLTTGSLGGANVNVGDTLSASVTGGPQCASGSAQTAVVSNPARPGVALLQLTSMSFSNCTLTLLVDGVQSASVVVDSLPYPLSIGDGVGDPATMGIMSLTFVFPGGNGSCTYASAAASTGGYSNASDSLTFGGSGLGLTGGTGAFGSECPTTSLTLPSLTAVVDVNQSGSPAVYVN
jgi:hypothetical protein